MRSLQILYVFVLCADVLTTFGSKVVIFSARNTKIYKICKLRTAIFSAFYNISRPNVVILLMLFLAVVVGYVLLAWIKI